MARQKPLTLDDCYLLGYIAKAHGVRGEVRAQLNVQSLEAYRGLEGLLLLIDDELVYLDIEQFRPQGSGQALIKLAEVDDMDAAEDLRGCSIYLPLAALPQLPDTQFYYHEIIGFRAHDARFGDLGTVQDVFEMPGQDLLRLQHPSGREVLVPILDATVPRVDRKARIVHTTVPDGLLDIYLHTGPEKPDTAEDDVL